MSTATVDVALAGVIVVEVLLAVEVSGTIGAVVSGMVVEASRCKDTTCGIKNDRGVAGIKEMGCVG